MLKVMKYFYSLFHDSSTPPTSFFSQKSWDRNTTNTKGGHNQNFTRSGGRGGFNGGRGRGG